MKTVTVFLWNGKVIEFRDATDWEKPVGLLHVQRAGDPLIYSYPLTSVEHWETLPEVHNMARIAAAGAK